MNEKNSKLRLSSGISQWVYVGLMTGLTPHLWDGVVDINPTSAGVDVQVGRPLAGQGVGDGRVAPLVVVVRRRPQETSPDRGVLPQEVWEEQEIRSKTVSLILSTNLNEISGACGL